MASSCEADASKDDCSVKQDAVVEVEATVASIQIIDEECFLIRGLLTLGEQAALFEYIKQLDKTPSNQPRAMVPAPKTLLLGDDGNPSVRYSSSAACVVNDFVAKAVAILKKHHLHVIGGHDSCAYKSLSMATIQYEAPNGCFPAHVDHCSDSCVFLASLGCSANFMVKGPTMVEKLQFKLHSGDALVFNASGEAGVLHSVVSIDEGGPRGIAKTLEQSFPTWHQHRYGVQCRMFF
ncbi:Hypothetical Protein FCC1311_100742 [Hondaea fermentalgiana]|uniref:Fe2OG dioxygenase domain-containing protein n=1 Tax=Hondaea fermentalgiana TaxID=2315210 RepID=A0A2R5GZE7_9STRA|nr:Hypothetical Protein FCC1311_100742 [Hondaea fermentalgiana]|eukprot:GBG33851.1 Hypothetical Protein FCC1311_100742 [Hondaea fermentalgiana]